MKVLGIDPGTAVLGFGVVDSAPGGARLVECGVVSTRARDPLPTRLRLIHDAVAELLARHRPDAMAVESVFYAKNVRTTVVLGHARGVALLAGAMRDLPIAEYAPAEVKSAIVGSGRATKEQLQYMVQQLLRLRTLPRPADAADAVAVALCHCHSAALERRLRSAVR